MKLYDVGIEQVEPGWHYAVAGLIGDLSGSALRQDLPLAEGKIIGPETAILHDVPEHERAWLERRFAERHARLRFTEVSERRYVVSAPAERRSIEWHHDALVERRGDDVVHREQLASPAAAREAFVARCASLESAGERLVDDSLALIRASSPHHDELAQALARPGADVAAAREVTCDWLLSRGDARGELAALQRSAERADDGARRAKLRSEAEAHLREHADAIVGPLRWHRATAALALTWRGGFIDGAHLLAEPAAEAGALDGRSPRSVRRILRLLFGTPAALTLTELGCEPGAQQSLVDATLDLAPPPTLAALDLGYHVRRRARDGAAGGNGVVLVAPDRGGGNGDPVRGEQRDPLDAPASSDGMVTLEGLAPLLARLPGLRRLSLRGDARGLDELASGSLESLRLDSRAIGQLVNALPHARLPRLRSLDLRVRWWVAASRDRVERLLAEPPPALEALTLVGVETLDGLATALADSPRAPALHRLVLVARHGSVDAAQQLGRAAARFAALRSLVIAPLDDAQRAALGPLAQRLEPPPGAGASDRDAR